MTKQNFTTEKHDKQEIKLINGVGVKSKGRHKTYDNGAPTRVYETWRRMIARCYCPKLRSQQTAYSDCSVDSDWLDFQVFAEWFESHEHGKTDYQLDKDILVNGNRVYSADTCCLVPRQLNNLLVSRHTGEEPYPQGVYFQKALNKFSSRVSINGKKKHLGCFLTADEAYMAYVLAKEAYVKEKALEWRDRIDSRAFEALMAWTVY